MQYIRDKKIPGAAYFRTANVLSNLKGVLDSIHTYYPTPAKLPPLTWLNNIAPNSPTDLQVFKDKDNKLNIKWSPPTADGDYTYTVYVSDKEPVDTNNAGNILSTGLRTNSYAFTIKEGDFGYYYTVTASDRYHNESTVTFPAFFSHSANEQ